ncbi:MAG: bifunctional phosphopantothenoylcysteine decarboxylase/phosphopantothenate--cysteine ligase CoaBC [Acidobacteriota bacterium]|nr:bifunctional phosphopantothenoylcysteine decarboxylase/phosphopantothenate--cysteine ligase CoaBC [Acidobacteriota bacterium]
MDTLPPIAPRITLGVCGGVAAYKAAELVRALQQHGADVHVVMTRAAEQFVQPLTFSSLTGHKVITSLWGGVDEDGAPASGLDDQGQIEHIAEAQAAQALVIAPATANILAKLAHGLADDFLTTLYLATPAPVIVAPAMNVAMWNHPATRANLKLLRDRGTTIVEPEAGYLACGMTGSGRLAAVEEIARAVMDSLGSRQTGSTKGARRRDLAGETILVTAGGTQEAIDPVRYLGNRSSGKMGYAIAEAAGKRGAKVVLVSAPTALSPPARCAFVPVTSAEEMRVAVMEHLPSATVVIKAAAVADFRMSAIAPDKLRRTGHLHLDLEPTEDIVRGVVDAQPPGTLVIAFAAETNADVEQARGKLLRKGAHAIVLNDVSRPGIGFDSDRNAAMFVTREAAVEIPEMSKRDMADRILDQVLGLRAAQRSLQPQPGS